MITKVKDYTFQSVGKEVEELKGRMDKVEKKVDLLQATVIDIQNVLGKIENNINKLSLILTEHIKKTDQEIQTLKSLYKNQSKRIEDFTENFETRIQILEKIPRYVLNDKAKS